MQQHHIDPARLHVRRRGAGPLDAPPARPRPAPRLRALFALMLAAGLSAAHLAFPSN